MNRFKYIFLAVLVVLLVACGGGSGSNSSTSVATAKVGGVASMGIIKGGTIAVYPVSADGVKGSTPLATGKTDANGAYLIDIGSYSGPIVVEASGTYLDEATGKEIAVPASSPLHAVLDYVTTGKSFNLPVTPLTELAYRHAAPLTAANIREANDLISYIMRLDIINTVPVAPTAAAFATATQSQQDYALILAAISQIMATNGTDLDTTLTSLNSGLSSTATATALNSALSSFIANPNNQTGENTVPATLLNIGTVGKKLTLALSGTNISSVQAFTATLTLPAGLLLRTDADGVPLPSVFSLSSNAAAVKNITYTAHYVAASGTLPATITLALLVPSGGLTAGDVITITCDTAGDTTAPATSTVILSGIDFWDQNGSTLPVLDRPVLSLI